ncbi:VOC family protein [Streptomyces sp. NPDC028722]|uniref:VOC family protein n=1 Tax=Streptomyces sp. NPDC028722 TaxID=3155016 RepID=UPI0033C813C1
MTIAMGNSDRFSFTLHNITTTVSDIYASVDWWQRVFGLELLATSRFDAINADVAFPQGPGFKLELLRTPDGFRLPELTADPPAHIGPTGTKALVFRVDDLAAATQSFRDHGVALVWSEQDLGDGGVSTAIRDNDGNFINVFQEDASSVG